MTEIIISYRPKFLSVPTQQRANQSSEDISIYLSLSLKIMMRVMIEDYLVDISFTKLVPTSTISAASKERR